MPGPLPNEARQRRNAPTIPTTKIPAGGRRGPIPHVPEWIELGDAGSAWWKWAWRTPEACAWDNGQIVKVAHRAMLEDDLSTVAKVESASFDEILFAEENRELRMVLGRLAGMVSGRLGILAKISDLDDKLGLSPKGREQLRLKVVADAEVYPPVAKATSEAGKVTNINSRRTRLTKNKPESKSPDAT